MEAAGIYIHVPFCVEKCRYCDFYSQTDLTRQAAYVQSVLAELRQVPPIPADTLYLGGGTPSLLSPGDIQSLIDTAADIFSLPPNAEITLEVNPGTLDREGFTACRAAGVNRLNIGIQSFQDAHLSFLGRIHSGDQAAQAIQWAGRAGFDNIGLDLIYGLPAQTRSDWKQDLTRALSHAPEHLSCYLLTYEPQTPLGRLQQVGRVHQILAPYSLPGFRPVGAQLHQPGTALEHCGSGELYSSDGNRPITGRPARNPHEIPTNDGNHLPGTSTDGRDFTRCV